MTATTSRCERLGTLTAVDIELRHLRAFVAVAEELNFTRAAKRLFIAQQALSTQIRQLEDRIGAKLLDRNTRAVSLTSAGEVLLAQARLLLADADTAVAATRAAVATRTPLTVGFVAAVNHPEMSHALDRFSERHPEADLMINFGDQLDPTGGLHEGQADVAFVYGPFDHRGLELTALYGEPLGIALAKGHHLATAATITVDVYFATEGLVASAGPGVVWRRVDELPPLQHYIARRSADDRPLVRAFVDSAVDTLAV